MIQTFFTASSLLLLMVAGSLLLKTLQDTTVWSSRRMIQYCVLILPPLILTLGFVGLHYLLVFCNFHSPAWKIWLDTLFPLCIGGVLLAAIVAGGLRILLLTRLLARKTTSPAPLLQIFVEEFAREVGVQQTRIRLCAYNRPFALTTGIFHPTIFLSQWMLEHLDQQELEAVLAHEITHIAHHDVLVMFTAVILRDAFFYLPSSQKAYRQLQQEKEFLCDERAAKVTRRPLALASALTKVWLHALETPSFRYFGAAQSLLDGHTIITHRIERLLHTTRQTGKAYSSPMFSVRISLSLLLPMIIVQSLNLLLTISLLCCLPHQLATFPPHQITF